MAKVPVDYGMADRAPPGKLNPELTGSGHDKDGCYAQL
jgi:hypothetical protein